VRVPGARAEGAAGAPRRAQVETKVANILKTRTATQVEAPINRLASGSVRAARRPRVTEETRDTKKKKKTA